MARQGARGYRVCVPTPLELVLQSFARRKELLGAERDAAYRLFNGYTEGLPGLVVELYGETLVVSSMASSEADEALSPRELVEAARGLVPGLRAALFKFRGSLDPELQHGKLYLGTPQDLSRSVRERGIRYALELRRDRDTSFFLDTRELRKVLATELSGKRVLNAFAYTGSLGVAAAAGGAREVVHLDRNKAVLNVAKNSYVLNGLSIVRSNFRAQDFFAATAELRRREELFDCVIVDPPFFSSSPKGRVDLVAESARLLNKARPLVGDGGMLVAVNNALFVSGEAYEGVLAELEKDDYVTLERRISVPRDVIGFSESPAWPADPTPYDYPTKIAILRVRRKDGRTA
jgi:23S rRNA (cytosine1962-C5)-methyltransferase